MISFMKVAGILELPSIEYSYNPFRAGAKTGDVLNRYPTDQELTYEPYPAIKEQMRKDGINAVPIHIADVGIIRIDYYDPDFEPGYEGLAMGNGHHRLAIAISLGFMYVKVSDDIMETGESDDSVISNDEWECNER